MLIASGIGAVPVVSLVKDIAARGTEMDLQVHLAVDRPDQVPELEQLTRIAERTPWVRLHVQARERGDELYSEAYFRRVLEDPRRRVHHESFVFG